ncbi:MAG TPA: agmatinase family protein [Bacteroidales bacterium]|nr:agmatinase family protein [Bacteroidales bacterium]HRR49017.1 agmatinase family protein [Bacteroidales bacterium]HRT32963.1 agmatinase family protein [Bacteroidales bacterium]HRT83311.1 agmatinase family protein [Bacteroidales bacterium]
MTEFNPNDIGVANGNFFGLPFKPEQSEIVLISVPWDVTTSYRSGTSYGPQAIMNASLQVDLFDNHVKRAWETKIGTIPEDYSIRQDNKKVRKIAEKVIEHLAKGESLQSVQSEVDTVNTASAALNSNIYRISKDYISKGLTAGIVGGEHSVPFGYFTALSEIYEDFGILQIDAHADLRKAYEGFKYSHASIMYNALNEIPQISQLTQVGIRDYCQEEADFINRDPRIRSFTDYEIRTNIFEGKVWKRQCEEIISSLPQNVYISFDIDGLSPDNCPNTGTPVPGGLSFMEADFLLYMLALSNKKIIGFDLCEVAPASDNEWDANVGARLLYKLCIYSQYNSKRQLDR